MRLVRFGVLPPCAYKSPNRKTTCHHPLERKILQELRNINKVIVDLDQILNHLNDGGEINDTLIQEIRETLKTLDLSIDDFNRAVEEEYGPSS